METDEHQLDTYAESALKMVVAAFNKVAFRFFFLLQELNSFIGYAISTRLAKMHKHI